MNSTKRADTGFTYFIIDEECGHTLQQIRMYIVRHGYTPGDGTTFVIIHPSRAPGGISYVLPAYGDPVEVARTHAELMDGDTFTTVNYSLDILDVTKYTISSTGDVLLEGRRSSMTPMDAAYIKGIQYNKGEPILTFKALSSFILSRYDWTKIGMVMCDSTHKYAVRKVSGGRLEILRGIIVYEREC